MAQIRANQSLASTPPFSPSSATPTPPPNPNGASIQASSSSEARLWTVTIKPLNSPQFQLIVPRSTTIGRVKERIAAMKNISTACQRLIFNGRVCSDASSLTECGIFEGVTIHMVVRDASTTSPLTNPPGAPISEVNSGVVEQQPQSPLHIPSQMDLSAIFASMIPTASVIGGPNGIQILNVGATSYPGHFSNEGVVAPIGSASHSNEQPFLSPGVTPPMSSQVWGHDVETRLTRSHAHLQNMHQFISYCHSTRTTSISPTEVPSAFSSLIPIAVPPRILPSARNPQELVQILINFSVISQELEVLFNNVVNDLTHVDQIRSDEGRNNVNSRMMALANVLYRLQRTCDCLYPIIAGTYYEEESGSGSRAIMAPVMPPRRRGLRGMATIPSSIVSQASVPPRRTSEAASSMGPAGLLQRMLGIPPQPFLWRPVSPALRAESIVPSSAPETQNGQQTAVIDVVQMLDARTGLPIATSNVRSVNISPITPQNAVPVSSHDPNVVLVEYMASATTPQRHLGSHLILDPLMTPAEYQRRVGLHQAQARPGPPPAAQQSGTSNYAAPVSNTGQITAQMAQMGFPDNILQVVEQQLALAQQQMTQQMAQHGPQQQQTNQQQPHIHIHTQQHFVPQHTQHPHHNHHPHLNHLNHHNHHNHHNHQAHHANHVQPHLQPQHVPIQGPPQAPPTQQTTLENLPPQNMTHSNAQSIAPITQNGANGVRNPTHVTTTKAGSSKSRRSKDTTKGKRSFHLGKVGNLISSVLRMLDTTASPTDSATSSPSVSPSSSSASLPSLLLTSPTLSSLFETSSGPKGSIQDLVHTIASSLTVTEGRTAIDGYTTSLSKIHHILNVWIRQDFLDGQEATETSLSALAKSISTELVESVNIKEICSTAEENFEIQFKDMAGLVFEEAFRKLAYMVVCVALGREAQWPNFPRDLILWIR